MLSHHKNQHWPTLLLLLVGVVAVEAALLGLADWQYHRYHQRLAAAAAQAHAPVVTLTGVFHPDQTIALDNQPAPPSGQYAATPGWRLLTPFTTGSATYIVDRGWYAPADRLTPTPDFAPFTPPSTSVSLTGIWQPVIPAHGWLRGPLITTNNHVLSRLEPTAVTSGTIALPLETTYFFQLTQPLANQSATLLSQPSPPPDPLRHLSYFCQWLAMALLFPVLCMWAWHTRKP